jgi:16S rRNA (cytosine1402-N4)-methyltransferase
MSLHQPVLAQEIVDLLSLEPGMTVVDGTLGAGGHARLLAEAVGKQGRVIAMDRDPAAVAAVLPSSRRWGIEPFVASYVDMPALLASISIDAVDAILLDLGLSSDQLADPRRGFSFQSSGDLDMRFDPRTGEAAWELLARLSEKELADVIFQYGEERYSRRIARQIVEARRREPLRTVPQLTDIVRRCVPRSRGHAIDPATRTFQALRIAVNDELRGLEQAIERLPTVLRPGGRLAVISFHSLEDRIVKRGFRNAATWEIITKKPIRASKDEARSNPRSRSAKLRVARKVGLVT